MSDVSGRPAEGVSPLQDAGCDPERYIRRLRAELLQTALLKLSAPPPHPGKPGQFLHCLELATGGKAGASGHEDDPGAATAELS